jgi:hypothetical protein
MDASRGSLSGHTHTVSKFPFLNTVLYVIQYWYKRFHECFCLTTGFAQVTGKGNCEDTDDQVAGGQLCTAVVPPTWTPDGRTLTPVARPAMIVQQRPVFQLLINWAPIMWAHDDP